ncbi:Cu(I)-responsive transcriptional regulator [Amylibacter kogurei]|uniref:Cu(I)-responsive transcriptional regulator n=1 Tax=Paramylibacter kogurei TaxID=1889778 RepID=A0A2G5K6T2_9RHOB|nr:Cu(I)-responsive transcriptional regulator [Amylibacter kogurei]PIB24712.1 Cu(I)-responsive transcriptional regulator [Amylibacter kogurei]
MNIGQAADHTGLPEKTIRYYEDIGLVTPNRAANGYRVFGENALHQLHFLAKARGLGFSIEDCRNLLALYDDTARSSSDVKAIAKAHVATIDQKISELSAMRDTLSHLMKHCAGDNRPDCPILNELSQGK